MVEDKKKIMSENKHCDVAFQILNNLHIFAVLFKPDQNQKGTDMWHIQTITKNHFYIKLWHKIKGTLHGF